MREHAQTPADNAQQTAGYELVTYAFPTADAYLSAQLCENARWLAIPTRDAEQNDANRAEVERWRAMVLEWLTVPGATMGTYKGCPAVAHPDGRVAVLAMGR